MYICLLEIKHRIPPLINCIHLTCIIDELTASDQVDLHTHTHIYIYIYSKRLLQMVTFTSNQDMNI